VPHRTLLLGARVVDPGGPSGGGALEVTGARVTFVGSVAQARARAAGTAVLELDGAVVTPAFVDAHVHATASGLLVDGLDLTTAGSPDALLDAVAARAAAARAHSYGVTGGRTTDGRGRVRAGPSSTGQRPARRCT
jgi:predicted amidohydrolase YtcJ